MTDNAGPYISRQDFLLHLFPSTFVTYKSRITLVNKSGNVFEYLASSFELEADDIVAQGESASRIASLAISPSRLTLDDATGLANGQAFVFRTSKTIAEFDVYRLLAMKTVDLYTGQWFNARTFDSTNPIVFEGTNTALLHFPVPIISVQKLFLNSSTEQLAVGAYRAHVSRAVPDDRRNPRIQLVRDDGTIFTDANACRLFAAGYFTTIECVLGFLEPDGTTPSPIQWATARIAALRLAADLTPTSGGQEIRREKTDLHEIEYQASERSAADSSQTQMTGDAAVDRILSMYRAPISVGASTPVAIRTYLRAYDAQTS